MLEINAGELYKLFRNKIHTAFLTASAVIFLLCTATKLSAAEIVVVKSSALKPYNDALEGFKSTCLCTVRELNLAESGQLKRQILESKPAAVLAIGVDALNSLGNLDGPPLFYTMVSEMTPELAAKTKHLSGTRIDLMPETYLNTMRKLFPKAGRIGIIFSNRNTGAFVKAVQDISYSNGFEIIAKEVTTPREVPNIIEGLREKIDMFWMLPDSGVITTETVEAIFLFSFKNKVPVFSFANKYVKMGAIASISADPFNLGAQTGEIVAKKLDHKDFHNHVHKRAQKTLLFLNSNIAGKMGVVFKADIIRQAEEVY